MPAARSIRDIRPHDRIRAPPFGRAAPASPVRRPRWPLAVESRAAQAPCAEPLQPQRRRKTVRSHKLLRRTAFPAVPFLAAALLIGAPELPVAYGSAPPAEVANA